MWHITTRNQ